MSNAKIILQAKGEQNIPLNKDPQKTFFKENYRKHAIFGTDWNILSNNFNGPDDFIKPNSKYYFRIDKNGDVIKNLYLRILLAVKILLIKLEKFLKKKITIQTFLLGGAMQKL